MDVADFDFDLPTELIAQEPPAERGASRLLHLDRVSGAITHTHMSALPALLRPGDVLVVNDTRVFPARLLGRRVPSGGAVECLLIAPLDGEAEPDRGLTPTSELASGQRPTPLRSEQRWHALMHPGQKLKVGSRVVFQGSAFEGNAATLNGEIVGRGSFGRRVIRLWVDADESSVSPSESSRVDAIVDAIGHVPLPPYIKRRDEPADRERYQTVFAAARGSVAAPTAGLHFSEPLLADLRARGVDTVGITLHVGYGTFQPVRVDRVEDHRLEPEHYEVGQAAADAINRALDERRRVVAVGTTTTRTLEAVARANGGRLVAGGGATNLFIFPGFPFRVIQGLITNFHVPRSSLLMLVSAFAGREHVLEAYAEAIARKYRFYSYGDAMLVLPSALAPQP
jgi:S-adenosylmethionine:tRNA ribosyltransferase-isomerase